LHYCVQARPTKFEDIVQSLLAANAQPSMRNGRNQMPIDLLPHNLDTPARKLLASASNRTKRIHMMSSRSLSRSQASLSLARSGSMSAIPEWNQILDDSVDDLATSPSSSAPVQSIMQTIDILSSSDDSD
jgi:hypothetical protein